MTQKLIIRNEQPEDHVLVETLTRKAFYNVYTPGCTEHYLVHIMRNHEDFIPQLDFVAEIDGNIIGNIMYTKATLTNENGDTKNILTFGPVCIAPEYQRQGYGTQLIKHSFDQALSLGYDTVVIFGSPSNYVHLGFKSCQKYHVGIAPKTYPTAMMVKELIPHVLDGHEWLYKGSPALAIREEDALRYDDTLEKMEKKHLPSQEEFYILSHSFFKETEN